MPAERDVEIRPARPTDYADLARFHVSAWQESYQGMMPSSLLTSISLEMRSAQWQHWLGLPTTDAADIQIAETDEIVGFVAFGAQRSATLRTLGYDAELIGIYVALSEQNRKIGRRLIAGAADLLSRRNYRALSLWVIRDNRKARRF